MLWYEKRAFFTTDVCPKHFRHDSTEAWKRINVINLWFIPDASLVGEPLSEGKEQSSWVSFPLLTTLFE